MAEGSKYTDYEVDQALSMLALCAGSVPRARKMLKAQGLTVPPQTTLNSWKYSREQRYREIQQRTDQIMLDRQTGHLYEAGDTLREGVQEGADLSLKALKEGEVPERELAGFTRNLAIAHGVITDKAMAIQGRPTSIVAHLNHEQVINQLRKYDLIAEAEEIEDAELEAGDDAERTD